MPRPALAFALMALAAPARADPGAQPAPDTTAPAETAPPSPPAFTLSGYGQAVTDYRFRGISFSNYDPAVQGQLRVDHRSGLYAAAWASNTNGYRGSDAEVDLYGGWTRTHGGWTTDGGLYGYLFPGARGLDFMELYGSLTRDLGPLSATAGVNYSADVLGRQNGYLYGALRAGIPGTPFSLSAGGGYEDGGLAREKADWNVGVTARRGRLSATLRYVGNDARQPRACSAVVLALRAGF